ncbi:PH domain-containing protein [Nocardioidaceae bacterium]|nr:PH domain-containing protein [Nocardioidaceae bacterium]
MVLREPTERVSPRAKTMWRVAALPALVIFSVVAVVLWLIDDVPAYVALIVTALAIVQVAYVTVVPVIRYRVHRWEVTHEAFYTRSGWLSRYTRIVPLGRVQTVDTSQGALERAFGLASVRVTTASGHGTAYVQGLEEDLAKQVVADLVRDTAATEGDAT